MKIKKTCEKDMRHTLKALIIILLSALCTLLSSCMETESITLPVIADYDSGVTMAERKNLKLGVVTGPYEDMFMEAILPSLSRKGYTVEIVYYDDYIQPNFALANGEIDMNMFQHYRYLNSFKFEYNLNLSAITEIPTASMGIFSKKYKSINDIKDEAYVSIPDDSTNLSRALRVMEAVGLVTIDSSIDKSKAVLSDLTQNPKNLQFVLIGAHNLVESLNAYDLSVINGNYALGGGLNLSKALYNEVLDEDYINVIAVRTEVLSERFVIDIIDTVNSDEYRNIITDPHRKYIGFQFPRSFYDTWGWEAEK